MEIKEKIKNLIKNTLKELELESFSNSFTVTHPKKNNFGDYSTELLLRMGSVSNIDQIVNCLKKNKFKEIENIEYKLGFINFYLSRDFFTNSVKEILKKEEKWGRNDLLKGQKIMVEYTQPNPFKPFHIGHLMSNAIGESISRIVEFSGAKTIRANYQGDIGPHVAKAIYGLVKFSMPDETKTIPEKAQYIGECYSKGSNLYDTDKKAKKEIDGINKKIYEKSDEKINRIYDWGRKVTLEAFEEIYKLLGTKFDYSFFESEMAIKGEKIVRENIGKIFEESEGAVIFLGEKYDKKLHTRVFINSQGLPTYETKEIGLTMTKFEKEKDLDLSIVTTAIEQAEYMKVVQKAIGIMHPDLEKRMKHITHGMMRLATGKMSSRKGNVITGESLINDSIEMIHKKIIDRDLENDEKNIIAKQVGISALKYSILKSSLGGDIVYDFEKSISFEGDSGPYLQYTAVRANSILEKAKDLFKDGPWESPLKDCPLEITDLEKLLYKFPEVVEYSEDSLQPHHIATYLTELASAFNTFYGNTKILESGNKYMTYHLSLVKAFYLTMKNGLWLLGIETPERM